MKLSRLRNDSRLARRLLLSSFMVVLLAAAASTGILAWLIPWHGRGTGFADRVTETGDVLAAGTLVLAFIAAIVAVAAYAVATGLPALEFQITFQSLPNMPIPPGAPLPSGTRSTIIWTYATIYVRNTSGYSARNPAVVIRLNGMVLQSEPPPDVWAIVDSLPEGGITAVQWDGVPAYSIHGRSTRRLPRLGFTPLEFLPAHEGAAFTIQLLAEGGYRREITVPAPFTVDGESETVQPTSTQSPQWF